MTHDEFEETRVKTIKTFAENAQEKLGDYFKIYKKFKNADGACAIYLAREIVENLANEMINSSKQ